MEINLSEDTIKVVLGLLNTQEVSVRAKLKRLERFTQTDRVRSEIETNKKYLSRIQDALSTFEELEVTI